MAKSYEISQSQLQEIEAARKKNRNKNVERRLYVLVMRAEGKSLEEISEKTGVSPSAVSRILNSDPSFSATTEVRLNVLKCAASLGYRTPRQKKDTSCSLTFGVADWHIIPEGQEPIYDLSFLGKLDGGHAISIRRLNRGEVVPLDGIIAFGIFTPEDGDPHALHDKHCDHKQ